MKSSPFTTRSLRILLACTALSTPTLVHAETPKRERGSDRPALKELETKPLNPDAIASLTDWTHQAVLDEHNTKGKVVLLAVVSYGHPNSYMTISKLTRLRRDFKDKGIVVAAIHPDFGFDQIQEKIAAGRISIPVARDKDAVFATAMHTDDYPDVYLIDRAGQLRYADIDERDLKNAVQQLSDESPESAIKNAARQAKGLEPETPQTQTPAIPPRATTESTPNHTPDSNTTPDQPTPDQSTDAQPTPTATFSKANPAAYASAQWPKHNSGSIKAIDIQGDPLPIPLGSEEWFYNERDISGKVLVLNFWVTWASKSKDSIPILDELYNENQAKLEIICISGTESRGKLRKYLEKNPSPLAHMYDRNKTLYEALNIKKLPHALVISTDGIVRWQGDPNDPKFKDAVTKAVEADPGFED